MSIEESPGVSAPVGKTYISGNNRQYQINTPRLGETSTPKSSSKTVESALRKCCHPSPPRPIIDTEISATEFLGLLIIIFLLIAGLTASPIIYGTENYKSTDITSVH
jgi:hypothetical protein